MRVVAGIAGGIPLRTPKKDIRPTMDKVRAAIFSSLGDRVPSAKVIDLFAGSGALGIEALSRGATSAVFVEQSRDAAECIRTNLASCHLEGVIKQINVFTFLNRNFTPCLYDLIFADPPYRKNPQDLPLAQNLVDNGFLHQIISPEGIFILEKYIHDAVTLPSSWHLMKSKRYGQTDVLFLQPIRS